MIKRLTLTSVLVSFVFCLFARDLKSDAITYLKQNKKQFNLTDQDIADLQVTDQYTDEKIGITHIYFRQSAHGVPLTNSSVAIHLNGEGKVAYQTSNNTQEDLLKSLNSFSPNIKPEEALRKSGMALGKTAVEGRIQLLEKKSKNDYLFDHVAGVSKFEINVLLELYKMETGEVKLVWKNKILSDDKNNFWDVYIDAQSGAYLKKYDNVVHCNYEAGMFDSKMDPNNNNNNNGFNNDFIANNNAGNSVAAAGYRVFPFNVEAPNFGSRQLLSGIEDATASPYGWHDNNGVAGAEFTYTKGNNVYAYEDKDNNNTADANSAPDGGASLNFDFPLDFTKRLDTLANTKPVVTQLFYINNIVHDIMTKYGFTEAAGNFQDKNYSGVAGGKDFVNAEAHDGSGRNNANFYTSPDGVATLANKSRMQMYMFDGFTIPTLTVNAPALIAGPVECRGAAFGPCSYNVTGPVVYATPNLACGPLSNQPAITGKIAMIDRGDCFFTDKVRFCQQAGAVGVIVVNRLGSGDSLITMALSGIDNITIPAVAVSENSGGDLKAQLANGLNVTLFRSSSNNCLDYDGALDNGVMIHEYGHGISTRLAGGPSVTTCFSNAEQAGEGWSDFFAMALTHKPGDTKNTARGMGSYVVGETSTGAGIRRYPYSYDMSINPLTYGDMAASTEAHDIGEIWCITLWDLYWNMIDQYGYSSDLYNGNLGNNKTLQLVNQGLKLQTCGGGYLDYRNAILKADSILYAKANTCLIWTSFARRGMGYSAKQGSASSASDQTAAFDMPPSCNNSPTATANFSVSDTTVCAGSSLTFTNTSTASTGTPDSVRWTIPGGTPSTSTSITTVSPVFNTTGTYVISLVAYKSGTPSPAITKSIRVKAKPVVAVNSPTICSGASTSLTASGAAAYSWNTVPAQTGTSITVSPTSTTSYIVTGTTALCSTTATSTVTVNQLPTVSANSPTICAGQNASLTATGTGTSYSWNTVPAQSGTSISVSPTTTTSYIVTATSAASCTSTATATVTVNQLPTLTVNSPSICTGQSTTLTATGNGTSFLWNTIPAQTTASINVSPTATTSYTVTAYSAASCSKTAIATVTVSSAAPTVVINPNPASVCLGDAITLKASGANSYVWDQPGGTGDSITLSPLSDLTVGVSGTLTGCTTAGTSSVTITVKPKPTVAVNSPSICSGQSASLTATGGNTYTWTGGLTSVFNPTTPVLSSSTSYVVTGTAANGCKNTATASVTVSQSPPTALATTSNAICNGASVTLTASGASSYIWLPSGSGPSQVVSPASTVTYTVTGSNGSTCTSTASQTITVTDIPGTPAITQSNDTLYSSVIVAGANYEWYKNSVLQATTSTAFYKFSGGGDFTLKVIKNSCESTLSAVFTAIPTGIRNSSNSIKQFEIYPNPTEGRLTVNLILSKNSTVQISVYTPEGRELYAKQFGSVKTVNEELNINSFAKGVYVIKLNVDSEVYYQKVIKD